MRLSVAFIFLLVRAQKTFLKSAERSEGDLANEVRLLNHKDNLIISLPNGYNYQVYEYNRLYQQEYQ